MILLETVLFGSILMLFYIYLGYPILVYLGGRLINKRIKKESFQPYVTIIIPAYNEEEWIEETIKNKLALNYPKDKLEIIVISDGSTDKTEEIVTKFRSHEVKLLRQEPRSGKTSALNMAVPHANGEILVFSDANSMYEPNALEKLMQNFNDPTVGYVTGKMVYGSPEEPGIEGASNFYMKYENFLRENETKLGSIVGVNGGIDAIRKKLFQPMNPDQLPDFVLPLKVVEQGYRVVFEPEAILRETSLNSYSDEYHMRVRVSLRSLWALSDMRQLLSLRKFRIFAWQLWSHKALRYLSCFFLAAAYVANLFLWREGPFYKFFFILQNACYLAAMISPLFKQYPYFLMVNYFLLLNAAAMDAFTKFIFGHKKVLWEPRKG